MGNRIDRHPDPQRRPAEPAQSALPESPRSRSRTATRTTEIFAAHPAATGSRSTWPAKPGSSALACAESTRTGAAAASRRDRAPLRPQSRHHQSRRDRALLRRQSRRPQTAAA